MSSISNYLTQSSGHIDSLISYVLDIKPYHAKLSAAVEQYIFHDDVNSHIIDKDSIVAFLGADLLPYKGIATVRARRSQSWWRNAVSDGSRTTWQVPLTSINKYASHSSRDKFQAGVNDDTQIPGLTSGVYSQTRWDGPGITDIQKNSVHQQDGFDYLLSHGVYSFDVIQFLQPPLAPGVAMQRWQATNTVPVSQIPENDGVLAYYDVVTSYLSVTNITGGNYEEWTLTRVDDNLSSVYTGTTATMMYVQVKGSVSGILPGHAVIGASMLASEIGFTLGIGLNATLDSMQVGDTVLLSPATNVVISPTAPEETWSLIKTNPSVFVSPPIFTPVPGKSRTNGTPVLEVHTRSLDYITESIVWTVVMDGNGGYVVNRTAASYGGKISTPTQQLTNGCAYRDDYIHFTLIPTLDGYWAGDTFSFTTAPRSTNYAVYGSVSGWQANAKIGEWYWNGKIGFKIPKLEYFAKAFNSTIIAATSADNNSWLTMLSNNQVIQSINFDSTTGVFSIAGLNSIVGVSTDGKTWSSDVAFTPTSPLEYLIVVGQAGAIGRSTDGITWYKQVSNVIANLNKCVQLPLIDGSSAASSLTVAVGDHGTILTSANGIGWDNHATGTTNNLFDITHSNNEIIVVGDNGTILRSTDRLVWTLINSTTLNSLNAVTYQTAMNRYIAVGANGTILTSTDGGLTWVNLSIFTNGNFSDVIWGNNEFVIVDNAYGWVAISPDGLHWTRYQGKRLNGIAWGNGTYIGVGGTSYDMTQFIPQKLTSAYSDNSIHSVAEPSIYTITFMSATTATVMNNLYGYLPGLKVNTYWTDGISAFIVPSLPNNQPYERGDTVQVYLAPAYTYTEVNGYSGAAYEISTYDSDSAEITVPLDYNKETYPLFHSHGSVIFKGVQTGDKFIIDKMASDTVKFKITGASILYPELGPDGNDWIPLSFKYYDVLDNSVNPPAAGRPLGSPTSTAEFSDLVTFIDAYLGSDPDVRVFSIVQPRYNTTNYNGSATFIFNDEALAKFADASNNPQSFIQKYLPFGTNYELMFQPDESYGQTIRVKITEDFRMFSRIREEFYEGPINQSYIWHWNFPLQQFNPDGSAKYDAQGKLVYSTGYYSMNLVTPDLNPYPFNIYIDHSPIEYMNIIEDVWYVDAFNAHFVEGGSLPLEDAYSFYPYNSLPYNQITGNGILPGIRMLSPAVYDYSGPSAVLVTPAVYDYTGSATDWTMPLPTTTPSIHVEEAPDTETAGSSFSEGLTFAETEVTVNYTGFDSYPFDSYPFDTDLDLVASRFIVMYGQSVTNGIVISQSANEYIITMQNRVFSATPTLIVQSIANPLLIDNPAADMHVFPQFPEMVSKDSFKFTTSVTAPFRLTVV